MMPVFSSKALAGEHALITGATGGIGYETAKVLADMGASLTITGRNEEKLELLKEELQKTHPAIQVFHYKADIGLEQDRQQLVSHAERTLGPISLLVNNAGILGGGIVEELIQEEMEKVMHINYTSTVLLTQLVYRTMKSLQKGAVVNVASLSGLRGTYANTAYAASKFALIGFTHSFAVEAIRYGVRVNAVCPGFVDTKMGRQSLKKNAALRGQTFEEFLKNTEQNIPSGRITTPLEVAHTIAFLLTDAAANIIGESVKISGGHLLR